MIVTCKMRNRFSRLELERKSEATKPHSPELVMQGRVFKRVRIREISRWCEADCWIQLPMFLFIDLDHDVTKVFWIGRNCTLNFVPRKWYTSRQAWLLVVEILVSTNTIRNFVCDSNHPLNSKLRKCFSSREDWNKDLGLHFPNRAGYSWVVRRNGEKYPARGYLQSMT